MPRDIPVAVPATITALIKTQWKDGGIAALASSRSLEYNEAYSLLVKTGGARAMKTVKTLSQGLKCTRTECAAIFFIAPGVKRKAFVERLAVRAGYTLPQLSFVCWGDRAYIYRVINRESSGKEIQTLVRVANALKLTLQAFEEQYPGSQEAA
jgi:hypothetical protein